MKINFPPPVASFSMLLLIGCLPACSFFSHHVNLDGISVQNVKGNHVDFKSAVSDSSTVYVFMFPDCPITQKSMHALNGIYKTYSSRGVHFFGVVPNTFYQTDDILNFIRDYNIPFEMLLDPEFKLTKAFRATTAPEAFVITCNKIMYRGQIDNSFFALGKKRAVVDEFYLRDAVEAVLKNEPVKIMETTPVGCLIQIP